MTAAQPTPGEPYASIRRVLWITMGLNLVATAAKLAVGYATGSLSLVAGGLDSVFDSASNIIGLVGISIASQPPDVRHPYGHRKAETLAAVVIAVLLFVTTWELANSAIAQLRDPSRIRGEVSALSFGALALGIAVHAVVVWFEIREGRRLKSGVLIADAMHTRADIIASLAVVGGQVAIALGYPLADPLIALVVAAFMIMTGVDIIRENIPALMDEIALPIEELEPIILSVPGVVSSHQVRTRGTEAAVIADLHIRVDPAMGAERAHAVAHEVERRLVAEHPRIQDVTVHVEPATALPEDLTQERLSMRLRRLAQGLGLSVHKVWAYAIDDAYYVDVHIEADPDLPLYDAHRLASQFEERARGEILGISEITTHLEPLGQMASDAAPQSADREVLDAVQAATESRFGPDACHQVRVHAGLEGSVITLHCHLPGDISLAEAHRESIALERELHVRLPGIERVTVHTEPKPS